MKVVIQVGAEYFQRMQHTSGRALLLCAIGMQNTQHLRNQFWQVHLKKEINE